MGKVIDFRSKRRIKIIERNREFAKKIKKENEKILQETVKKGINNLDDEEIKIFDEIMRIASFQYESEKNRCHTMYLVLFRDELYVLHDMHNGSFEFIGSLNDLVYNYVH